MGLSETSHRPALYHRPFPFSNNRYLFKPITMSARSLRELDESVVIL